MDDFKPSELMDEELAELVTVLFPTLAEVNIETSDILVSRSTRNFKFITFSSDLVWGSKGSSTGQGCIVLAVCYQWGMLTHQLKNIF